MRHNVPVECAADLCGVNHKTAFEWRHRALTTASGCRDRIMMRDTVWVDEICISDTDLSKGYGQALKRGLSRQELCTCVTIDIHKNPVAVVCGHGKPSSARVRDAMGGRIAPGSLLIHDLEWAHVVSRRSTRDGARPLFQVFADAYERQSAVITTNLEFSRWGSAFGDDQMSAVIDCIVHHGRLVQFRRESCNVRHALMQEGQMPQKGRARPERAQLKSRCSFYSNPLDETRQIPGVSYENTRANQRQHPISIKNIGRSEGSLASILI